MATTILQALNFDPTSVQGHTIDITPAGQTTLNQLPQNYATWQLNDALNNDSGGYFYNPLANTTLKLEQACTDTANAAGQVGGLMTITDAAINTANSANNFWYHTNRLSGVTSVGTDLHIDLPHYSTAIAIGKTIIYLTHQNDPQQNNALIMGNFTSLFIGQQLSDMANTAVLDKNVVVNSITATPTLDGYSYSSNLTSTQISNITANLISYSTLMDTRRNADVNFFQAEQALGQRLQAAGGLINTGPSESYLLNNFVGTDKLKQRLGQTTNSPVPQINLIDTSTGTISSS
jgi:hypothetical protein